MPAYSRILLPWDSQPQEAVGVDYPGAVWVWGFPQGSSATRLINVLDGNQAPSQDANNQFAPGIAADGVLGVVSQNPARNALGYWATTSALNGLKEFTLLTWFSFDSAADNAQWINFRTDYQNSLDIFSQTSSSVTWGNDWAGAWNGTSNKTLSGLSHGQMVCLGGSMNQSGARQFHNGVFAGTKSGSAFTTSSTVVKIALSARHPVYGGAAFNRALSDSEMLSLTRNPWQLFAPRAIWVPVSAAGAGYTLTASPGAYTLSGQSATITRSRALTASPGSYTLSGQAATITRNRALTASSGAYTLSGQSATITYTPGTGTTYTLTADAGAYTLSGQVASLLYGRLLVAGVGSYAVTGQAATIAYSNGRQSQGGGGWLPAQRRRTRKELHAERVRLGILPPDVVKAAAIAAAIVMDEPSPVKAYKADPDAANKVFLRELGVSKMLPDYSRAIRIQIEIQQQEDEDLMLFF